MKFLASSFAPYTECMFSHEDEEKDLNQMFINERNAVITDNTLMGGFCERWNPLVDLSTEERSRVLDLIKDGTYERLKVGDTTLKLSVPDLTAMSKFAAPSALLICSILAKEYGAPPHVVLHQRFCTGPHDNCF